MASLFLFLGGCQKDEALISKLKKETDDKTSIRSYNSFNDTSRWELVALENIMKKQDPEIIEFQRIQGFPKYDLAFQKSNTEIKITTIPTLKDNNLTGVFKFYQTFDDTLKLEYFSITEIDSILNKDLATKEYHIYRGAIQSLVISQLLMQIPVTTKYLDWLNATKDRVDERVKFYCVEVWDCTSSNIDTNTGWTHLPGDLQAIPSQANGCILLSRECYIDWGSRIFPTVGGASINWNHHLQGSGIGSSSGDGSNDAKAQLQKEEEERKKRELAECIASQGDIATEAMLNEALKDVEFPCINFKETVMLKEEIKNSVKKAWCEDQYDNPLAIKPKMTAEYIQNEVNKALQQQIALQTQLAVQLFLELHNNDAISTQIGQDIIDGLCGPGTGGSGNAVKVVDLEEVYAIMNNYGVIDLSSVEIAYLVSNSTIRAKINSFIERRADLDSESKKEAIKLYSKLLATVTTFGELDAVWPTIPAFVWPFIKDIGAELGAELFKSLAKKYTPAGQVDSVIDGIKALGQGELVDFIAEVFNIIKTKFPAAAIVDAGIDSYDLYKRAEPVWQAISKMEKFGGDVIEKFLTVIKGTGGNILDKFKWKNNSVGAELLNVGNPQTFWDNFKNLFPDITGPYPNPQQPLEQVYKVLNDSIIIRFYPVSDTSGGPTLALKINSHEFKIRFN